MISPIPPLGQDGPLEEPPVSLPVTRSLVGTTASMVGFKMVSTAAVVGVGVVTARQLEPSDRGAFVLMVTIASFGLLISSLGVNVSARVYLVAEDDTVPSGDYIGLAGALAALQAVVCFVLGLTLLPVVGVRLSYPALLLFALLGAALLGQYLLNDALNAYGHTILATTVEAAGSFTQLTLVVVLAFAGQRSVGPFIGALLVANGCQTMFALVVLSRVGVSVRPHYCRARWRLLLRKGLYGIPAALGQLLTFRIDRYLVGLFLNPAAVAVYAVAATAPELLRLPSLALGQPILYRLASGSASPREFRRVRTLCLALTIVSSAVVALVAPTAVRIIFGSAYLEAVTPLRLLLLGELGIAIFYLDSASLAGTNKLRYFAIASMVGLGVVAVLDIGLIPLFGLAGAAWASVAAYSAMGAAAALLTRRAERVVQPL